MKPFNFPVPDYQLILEVKKTRRHHVSDGAIQNAMKKIVREADLVPPPIS